MVLSMERWRGKVAVVTGASSGIGAAIATALTKEGLTVVGLARRVELIEELSSTLQNQPGIFHAIKCDVSKEQDIKSAFKQIKALGPVYILINNAGISASDCLIDGATDSWRLILDTNIVGLCVATSLAIKDMKANNVDGHVIHVNSIFGHSVPNLGSCMYPVSKFGVTAATEVHRQELVACNSKIKISSISPGCVETEMTKEALDMKLELFDSDPLQAVDVADTVLYVLSTPPHVQIHDVIIKPVGERF